MIRKLIASMAITLLSAFHTFSATAAGIGTWKAYLSYSQVQDVDCLLYTSDAADEL